MNRKITSHERMDIDGRYHITEDGNQRLTAHAWLAEHENHVETDLYMNEEKTFSSGSIRVYCPQRRKSVHVNVTVMHGKVTIELHGDMPGEIKDHRRPEGGEEE